MGRFFMGVASALLLVAAGVFWWKSGARAGDPVAVSKAAPSLLAARSLEPPPSADLSREQKRFDRYDKDETQSITREEYLAPRRNAWEKLDINHDGRLSFEEWAARTTDKFAAADANRSGTLDRTEFATTKVKRKSKSSCVCSPARDEE